MGKVFRLPWELNLLLSCFWALSYGSGKLGSIWEKKRRPPPFTHLAVFFHRWVRPKKGQILGADRKSMYSCPLWRYRTKTLVSPFLKKIKFTSRRSLIIDHIPNFIKMLDLFLDTVPIKVFESFIEFIKQYQGIF